MKMTKDAFDIHEELFKNNELIIFIIIDTCVGGKQTANVNHVGSSND